MYQPLNAGDDERELEATVNVDEHLLDTGADGLQSQEAQRRLQEFGRNELEEKTKSKWVILRHHFTGPMPIMIWAAILIEAIITDWANMGVLLFLQMVNGLVGFHEDCKAGDAVAALKASLKPEATVKRDGKWQKINAAELVPGDLVVLGAGANIPADCRLRAGDPIEVDQAALTGESLPVTMYTDMVAKMGSTVTRGEIEAVVYTTGKNTFFGKTAAMIQSVDEVAHFQVILLAITKFLLVVSLVLDAICFIFLLNKHQNVLQALAFCVVLLVASIPIAMQVVCTTTMALGSRKLAEQKAIVARLSSIEELASMNMLCSDKTGTLTLNKMVLQDVFTYMSEYTSNGILTLSCLAARWKEPAKDALDTLVLNAIDLEPLDVYTQLEYSPFDPTKKRTEATLQGPDGRTFKVMKGAPNVILGLCSEKCQADIKTDFEAQVNGFAERGIRCLAIAREYVDSDEGNVMAGLLTFLDPPRPDTKRTIERAKEHGVGVKMITGDHTAIAKETCRTLNLGDNILPPDSLPDFDVQGTIPSDLGEKYGESIENCNGFAQVFPEHKFLIVEALRQRGWKCGMTGDGVNDAPALKKADVGIAVQGATDAACAASDLILTAPGLSVIIDAITISRSIFQRMKNYVIYRVACTIQLLTFFFCAVLFMRPQQYHYENETRPQFFNLPVMALVVITILNDGTIISIAYDNVIPSTRPERWNLPVLFVVATWLGLVAVASSMLLLHLGLDGMNPKGFFCNVLGLRPITYDEVMTIMYLKISLSDFFTVFAARTQSYFWTRVPGTLLGLAAIVATASSTLLSLKWPFSSKDDNMASISWGLAALVWLYCLIWFIVQDNLKVVFYKMLYHYDVDGIRTEAEACEALAAENSIDARMDRVEASLAELKSLFQASDTQAAAVQPMLAGR